MTYSGLAVRRGRAALAKREPSFEELSAEWLPWIRWSADRFFAPGLERQDLVQEGLIALWEATRSYDASIGAFGPFAGTVIKRRLGDAVGSATRGKHGPLNGAGLLFDDQSGGNDPANVLLERERLQQVCAVVAGLPPRQSRVAHMLFNGFSYEEIAAELGTDLKAVDNSVQYVRNKCKRAVAA